MAQQRPKVLMRAGRINEPLRVPIYDLLVDPVAKTFLSSDMASASGTLTVKNINGFAVNQFLLIGEPGNQGSEIVKTHASTIPSGSTITLAANTVFPHSASTNIYAITYDVIEYSHTATLTGSKSVLATRSIVAGSPETVYYDTSSTSGYYFARFNSSINKATFSDYSDSVPYGGYTALTARSIISSALGDINKETSAVLSDEYAFQQINNCQIEVLREQKRWSFMQQFGYSLGNLSTGQWRVAVPTDLDDQNTNKSVWNFKIGTLPQLTWVDKDKWNDITQSVANTTLAVSIIEGASTITLTDSGDFDDAGTVYISSHTYSYTANNRSTNVLTLSTVSTTTDTLGADVFSGASLGLPQYWTTFGGYAYFYPVLGSSFDQRNAYMDYYKALTTITSDSDTIVLPDPTVVQYYLQWKFLKKLKNGEETNESLAAKNDYLARREKLKQKDSLNRSYRLKPTRNDINLSGLRDDQERIRDANFPNI